MVNSSGYFHKIVLGFAFFSSSLIYASTAPLEELEPSLPTACMGCANLNFPQQVRWNYVLDTAPDLSIIAQVYDIDGFDNTAQTVANIHAQNGIAVCYISAGSWEKWRPDANQFPSSILGKSNGWPGEKWLDIRQISILTPILEKRVQMCQSKGFDAIEFDNVDGYTNRTGFPLTAKDQSNFNIMLANLAHKYSLLVGLKNDLDQVVQLQPYFDFAVNEQCFQYEECDLLAPFTQASKPVLQVEYSLKLANFCPQAKQLKFSSILKSTSLDNPVSFCP